MTVSPTTQRQVPLVEGTVVDLRREADEPADFDGARVAFIAILVVDLLVLAAILLAPVFLFFIILFILLGFLGITIGLSHFFLLGLHASLSFLHRSGGKGVPVVYLRIQDRTGAEHDVRMKGLMKSGSVMPGDVLRVWGRAQQGTIFLSRAENLKTGSWVEVGDKPMGGPLAVLLGINALVVIFIFAALSQ